MIMYACAYHWYVYTPSGVFKIKNDNVYAYYMNQECPLVHCNNIIMYQYCIM